MAKNWTIRPHGVEGGGMPLISCKVAELVDDDGTQHYALFGPNGTWRALAEGPLPAEFPSFTAQLNGTNECEWYIKIERIDSATGAMTGTWGHNGYRFSKSEIVPPADPDTWTAQASSGAGTGGQEEPVAASAAASSKK
jgi:hypothetical protein